MSSRQSNFQRQRSASLSTNPQLVDTFMSRSSFPVFRPIPTLDTIQQPTQSHTKKSAAQQVWIRFSKAKPHYQILTPFPIELDRRFVDREKADLTAKQKGKQKISSEDVRCFWAIISIRPSKGQDRVDATNFAFLHIDPTLEGSIGYSVESLIDMSILEIIHPSEATKIEMEILQYTFEKHRKGTTIRCTMKSVMSMGRYLHSTQNERRLESSTFARSVERDHQLTDIRLEPIGDDMLLCFFHQHADEERSRHNDDQRGKTQWSNCRETSLDTFNDQHCQMMWQHIFSKRFIDPLSSAIERHQSGFPKKVFQIWTNGITPPNILFSWPPPRLFDSLSHHSDSSVTESYNDGSYFADVLARSAFETKFREENSSLSQPATACARRQIKIVTITIEGLMIESEVILIPRGDIKFVIFSLSRAEHINQDTENQGKKEFPVILPPDHEAQPIAIANSDQQHQTSFSQPQPDLAFSKSVSPFHSMAAASSPSSSQTSRILHTLPVAGMMDNAEMSEYGRRLSSHFSTTTSHHLFPSAINNDNFYQPQPVRTSYEPSQNGIHITSSSYPVHRFRSYPNSLSELAMKRCFICGSSNSPEWRKSPYGNKNLCNACGLRFSRIISRERKKDEKAKDAAEVVANGCVVPEHLRRKFEAGREQKKFAFQKHLHQAQKHRLQQTAQMGTADLTGSAKFSPDLDVPLPPSVHASSSNVNTQRLESLHPVEKLTTDNEANKEDKFAYFFSNLAALSPNLYTDSRHQQQQSQRK